MGCGQSKAVDVAKGNAVVQRVLRRRSEKSAEKQIDASQPNEKNPGLDHEECNKSEEPAASLVVTTDAKNTAEISRELKVADDPICAGAQEGSLLENAESDKLINGSSPDHQCFSPSINNVNDVQNGVIREEGEKQQDAGQVTEESTVGSDQDGIVNVLMEELVAEELEDKEHHGSNNQTEESLHEGSADHERQEEQVTDERAEEEEEKTNQRDPMELDQAQTVAAEEKDEEEEEEEEVPSADHDLVQEEVEESTVEEDHHSGAGDDVEKEEAEEIAVDEHSEELEREVVAAAGDVDSSTEEVQEISVEPLTSHEEEREVAAPAAVSDAVQDADESSDVDTGNPEAAAAGDGRPEVEESNVEHVAEEEE